MYVCTKCLVVEKPRGQGARRAIAEAKQHWPVIRWVIKNLLSRAPSCFERHVKPLLAAGLAVVWTHSTFKEGWRPAGSLKNNCHIFITSWWKHVVPTPLSRIKVGKRRWKCIFGIINSAITCTVHSTADYTLWTFYHSYFKGMKL
jgi:hypothetical protein